MDQEEIFVVIDGEATFETLECEVTVGKCEAIRFAPGEFQSGKNESDGELTVLAMGAPRDTEDIRIPADCPECQHDDLRLDTVATVYHSFARTVRPSISRRTVLSVATTTCESRWTRRPKQ